MNEALGLVLVGVLLVNFLMLGTSRLNAAIHFAGLQGVLLGTALFVAHGQTSARVLLLALATVALKGAAIPTILLRALRNVSIRREIEPIVGFTPSLVLGALATGLSLLFARSLPLQGEQLSPLIVPASFATVLTGFLVLTTRRKAITQVVGYLTLENGVFVFGLLLVEAIPFLVEIGVLLDLLVAVFVLGIIMNHIQREFSSLSTEHLTSLRE
ncbi:MAG TPA: hydrogenase [Myxococcota bacterium]|nr:hydrogenase [Myxococcota bacterium]